MGILQLLDRVKIKLGIDKSIFFTSCTRIIQAIGGVVAIVFVAKYLTGVEQGFYYTFGSIVAIQVFFELGLNGIITQYVAHENSHLIWESPVSVVGERRYLSRLSSLLHFSIKWYLCFAGILLLILVFVGFVFFNRYSNDDQVVWQLPWILLAIGTALNLLLAPILAYLEGLGKVKDVAKIRLFQQSIGLFVICGGLVFGFHLYVLGVNCIITSLFLIFAIYFSDFRQMLLRVWRESVVEKVDYKKEIFPYQWKIALSWISGYFIFQLFNPVLFATEGAVVAGQMGMTLAALNGVQALSISWMSTKVPLYSGLIAKRQFVQLDSIFNKTLKQSSFINVCLLIIMFVTILVVRYFDIMVAGISIGDRFLSYLPLMFMMMAILLNQVVNSWAIYLRCHKKEPFLVNSVVGGGLCALSTIVLGRYFGILGMTGGYSVITLIMFFWAYRIFKIRKYEWHGE